MEQINGYAVLKVNGTDVSLLTFPPKAGGQAADLKDVQFYLSNHGFTTYSVQKLNQCLNSDKEEVLDLGKSRFKFYSGLMVTIIDPDDIHCRSKVYPPSVGDAGLTKEDIMSSLSQDGVKYGIDEGKIDEFLKNPVYYTDISFAEGKPATKGENGSVEYFFNTDPSLEPKKNEDGSVDFHSLNVLNLVNKGDLLCRIHKEKQGEPGTSLGGKNITPARVSPIKVEMGKNVASNEEKTEYYADVTGNVMLSAGRLVVSDVYDVTGDVDNSTGDIDYTGSVHVHGSVRSGFKIKANGDVIVDGVVEDALIESGGQVIVKHGINGKGNGKIVATGNVISKFVENASVKSNGYIAADVILASNVQADGDIKVSGRKGFIAGGKANSGGSIKAETIGSEMGMQTVVEIGAKPDVKNRYRELNAVLPKLEDKGKELSQIIANYQQSMKKGAKLDAKIIDYLKQIAADLQKNNQNIQRVNEEIEKLKPELMATGNKKIVANRDIYPGVTIFISGMKKDITKQFSSCSFKIIDGEITRTTI